ncbi:MAG: choice-of-anchor J domain-containing protein, partial [candidate division WOR-3 bacterium]|nr:choice-of-anchor J domain-containing protein [candidate division WOR-3 bacterium]
MSKSQIILIGLLITFFFAFGAPGDSTLNESFNSTIYPEWPEGWRRFSFETVTDNFWALSNQQPLTRPFCIKCLGTNLTRNQDWIITRMVYPTPGDTIFSFWYEAHNRSVYESLEVWISTTTPDTTGMTVRLDAFNFNNNSYLERIINLSDYLNTPIYVGIFYPPFNRLGARIDDVTGPHYPPLDVSPIAITIPGSNFLSPGSFTPAAIIKNYGSTSPASFSAVCTLYNEFGTPVYSDDQNISPFLPNTTTSVNFIQTPLLARGNYTLVVRTRLNGDMQAINDRTARQLAVAQGTENLYDDGITTQAVWADVSGEGYGVRFTPASYPKIIQGAEIMLSHDAYPPQPADNIFRIRLIDDDGLQGAPGTILWESNDIYGIRGEWNYNPINGITINSGDYYLFWIQGENYTQCAGIGADEVRNAPNRTQWRFSGGTYSENGLPPGDLMIRSVESELISDVGVIAITAPPAMVDSGQSVIPQAIVKNFGTIQLNNVPVRFWIDTWQSDTIITTLAPNESTIVNFSSWTAAQRGNFAVKCSTLLTGDMNPANDRQAGSIFVRVLDVQTISIIQPADTVNLGDTITPQTFIRNNGNTNVTFPVRFE